MYAGLGGNRKHWEGVSVTAIEIEEDIAAVYIQQNPNDKVIIGDAHKYLLEHYHEFDFIWSSPPCQTHSRMMKGTKHKKRHYPDMTLYQEIIFLKHFFKGKWIVENVKPYYEPLIKPNTIIGRHCIWSNFNVPFFKIGNLPNFIQDDTTKGCERLKNWLGIHYDGNIYYKGNHSPGQVLRNCIHPDMGLHIFNAAFNPNKQTELVLQTEQHLKQSA